MLTFYNSRTQEKEVFTPITPGKVLMYVCGPTVYDRIHLGNARSAVIFDVLYRVLTMHYEKVIYVRNITDVDDKINAAALEKGVSIGHLTQETTDFFHEDLACLSCLPPTEEPKATEYIQQMIGLIQILIEKGLAYVAEGHVLFDVSKMDTYGALSHREYEEMRAGARVEVAPYKNNPVDFVLWKPSHAGEVGWESPWGFGRPGWHIECSAMSRHFLGDVFDIHGGGADLLFPHHENERAQSCGASGLEDCARYWMHNGMLTVEGQKMSKSLGNFVTLKQALQTAPGEVLRFALLSSHYRQTLDWTPALLQQARVALDHMYRCLEEESEPTHMPQAVTEALCDDLNTPLALSLLQRMARQTNKTQDKEEKRLLTGQLLAAGKALGFFQKTKEQWFRGEAGLSPDVIELAIQDRKQARQNKDYAKADEVRLWLLDQGILLEDNKDGTTTWTTVPS